MPGDSAFDASDFGETKDEGTLCFPDEDTAKVYKQGLVMNYTSGMCGFKFGVVNSN